MSELLSPERTEAKKSFNQPQQHDIAATAPGALKTIKRNGKVVSYDDGKIKIAISKAFIAEEGANAASSDRIHELIETITIQISQTFQRRFPSGGTLHIEDIQDQVELALMRNGQYKVARTYVLYREERRKSREATLQQVAKESKYPLITMPNGEIKPLDINRIETIVKEACRNLDNVSHEPIIKDAIGTVPTRLLTNNPFPPSVIGHCHPLRLLPHRTQA